VVGVTGLNRPAGTPGWPAASSES